MTFQFTGYNLSYLEETRRKAVSPLGRQIYQARWDLVKEFCPEGMLFDYGCADGAFLRQAPGGYCTTGWDINPESPYHENEFYYPIDIMTMWDVIEHLPSPLAPIVEFKPKWLFICTPNAETTDHKTFRYWRHFKPIEHLHYYTPLTLAMSLRSIGYSEEYLCYDEGRLRSAGNPEAIFTMVFRCLNN